MVHHYVVKSVSFENSIGQKSQHARNTVFYTETKHNRVFETDPRSILISSIPSLINSLCEIGNLIRFHRSVLNYFIFFFPSVTSLWCSTCFEYHFKIKSDCILISKMQIPIDVPKRYVLYKV